MSGYGTKRDDVGKDWVKLLTCTSERKVCA